MWPAKLAIEDKGSIANMDGATGSAVEEEKRLPSIIMQFMARSTMKAMLQGDPNAFGTVGRGKTPEELANEMYERTQKEKRDYAKKLRRDMVLLALGKGTDEWKKACFYAMRRAAKCPWLLEPDDYKGSEKKKTEEEKAEEDVARGSIAGVKAGERFSDVARGSIAKRRGAGASRILAALEAQMAAEREAVAQEGTREAELQAEMLKMYENQKAGAGGGMQKQLMKLRSELKALRRKDSQNVAEEGARGSSPAIAAANALRKSQTIDEEKQKKEMLRGKAVFGEDGVMSPRVAGAMKMWLENRQKKMKFLDTNCVEANPENKADVNELPLERTLGQPVICRRPRSSFSRFYGKASPDKSRPMFPSSSRPCSPSAI